MREEEKGSEERWMMEGIQKVVVVREKGGKGKDSWRW